MRICNLIACIALLGTILVSCDGYNKVIKSDDYDKKFEEANRLYDKGQYNRCVTLYEQVYQRYPKTTQGELAYYRLGKAYYALKDWYMGSYYLGAFSSKFPFSTKCEETRFLAALCSVQNSPEASLDQQETELALNELQIFINQFPNSAHVDTCNIVMDKLRFKLQTKEVLNVRLYSKTENYRAATVAAEQFLENYPLSVYREEVWAILLRNYYELTSNSIDTKMTTRIEKAKEHYKTFKLEFPATTYGKEFDNYDQKMDGVALLNVRNYSKAANYQEAVNSSLLFLENYSQSPHREEVWSILLRNSYYIAINADSKTQAEYITKYRTHFKKFVAEFPDSRYLREFENNNKKLDAIVVPGNK